MPDSPLPNRRTAFRLALAGLVLAVGGVLARNSHSPIIPPEGCPAGQLPFVAVATDTGSSNMTVREGTLYVQRHDTSTTYDTAANLSTFMDSGSTRQLAGFCRDTSVIHHVQAVDSPTFDSIMVAQGQGLISAAVSSTLATPFDSP